MSYINTLIQDNKIQDAKRVIKEVEKREFEDDRVKLFDVHYNLGIKLQKLGRLEEAEESYRQAIALKT